MGEYNTNLQFWKNENDKFHKRIIQESPIRWMTGYLNGNGAVDANAIAALTGIDVSGQIWSRVSLCTPPTVTSTVAGATGAASAQVGRTIYNTSTAVTNAVNVGGWKYATATAPAGTLRAIASTYDRPGDVIRVQVAASGGVSALVSTATGAEGVYATAAQIASLGGAIIYTGQIWGDIVLLAEPSSLELQSYLAGIPPWEIWSPALVARAWCPAAAYIDGANVMIPDLAQANGGVHTAINATLRNGDMGDIVIP